MDNETFFGAAIIAVISLIILSLIAAFLTPCLFGAGVIYLGDKAIDKIDNSDKAIVHDMGVVD